MSGAWDQATGHLSVSNFAWMAALLRYRERHPLSAGSLHDDGGCCSS